ncbi:MAG: hypothetical protein JXB23_06970, partial [Candidatus Aminicenantes bacterium]|nr:hypothetical protein [Candidatus Aminicenantes bacterium]
MKMRKITVARASGAGLRPNFKTRKIVGKLKSGYLLSKRKPKEGGESSSTKETMMVFGMGQQFMPGFPGAPGTGVPEEEVAKESPGIAVEVSKIPSPLTAPLSSEEKEMLRGMDEKYPLIPENPGRNEKIYAYARIKWDPTKNELVYFVVEPQLSEREDRMVEYVKKELEERLDIDFMKLGEIRAKELLDKEIRHIISGIKGLDSEKIDVINYYVQRNIIGLDRIEPLMKDKSIEDISCDGEKTPIFIYHRNPLYGSMRSNIIF